MEQQKKCLSVNLTLDQVAQLKSIKEKSGKTQSQILTEAVQAGLQKEVISFSGRTLFLVKVRIDIDLLMELGEKLQTGELEKSMILFTYCLRDDPSVGVSLWIADDRKHFNELFAPHTDYYKEIIYIQEVILPEESMKLILASSQ